MGEQKPRHVTIDRIWIDVSVREVHGLSSDVTEHPVEQGSDVADHIRPGQRVLSLEGIVTNTPIEVPKSHLDGARSSPLPIPIEGEKTVGNVGLIPGVDQGVALLGQVGIDVRSRRQFPAQALHFTTDFDRVTAVYQALLETQRARKLVTIVTALEVYEGMALVDIQTERSNGGGALRFSAIAKELRLVASKAATADPLELRAKAAKALGKQATEEVAEGSAEQEVFEKSVAAQLLGF